MKNEKPETLETALKELIRHIRDINELENLIDEKWGVRLIAGFIPGYVGDSRGEVNVRRGIEEIEKGAGPGSQTKRLFPIHEGAAAQRNQVYPVRGRQDKDICQGWRIPAEGQNRGGG